MDTFWTIFTLNANICKTTCENIILVNTVTHDNVKCTFIFKKKTLKALKYMCVFKFLK